MRTVSLELARELDKAGIKIDTDYIWGEQPGRIDFGITAPATTYSGETSWQISTNKDWPHWQSKVAAPTTDELLEWLPDRETFVRDLFKHKGLNIWCAGYRTMLVDGEDYYESADTPADALAKLALWVKENNGR